MAALMQFYCNAAHILETAFWNVFIVVCPFCTAVEFKPVHSFLLYMCVCVHILWIQRCAWLGSLEDSLCCFFHLQGSVSLMIMHVSEWKGEQVMRKLNERERKQTRERERKRESRRGTREHGEREGVGVRKQLHPQMFHRLFSHSGFQTVRWGRLNQGSWSLFTVDGRKRTKQIMFVTHA